MDSAGIGLSGAPWWNSSSYRRETACVPGKTRQPPVILVTALAAGSTGPRRRRCSLCVHLPRGKGGWPRPWCAWFSRARSLTKHDEDVRSRGSTSVCMYTRLFNYLSRASSPDLSPLGTFPLHSFLSPSLYKSRASHLFLSSPPREGTHLHTCSRWCVRSHGSWNDYRYARLLSSGASFLYDETGIST